MNRTVSHTGNATGGVGKLLKYENGYVGSARTGSCWDDDHIEVFHMDEILPRPTVALTRGEDTRTFLYKGVPHCLTWHPAR